MKDQPNGSLAVLIVDDERLSRVTTARQLSDAGYTAMAVASGEAALGELAAGAWDVVLTDLRMPGIDGIALLERVVRDYPGTDVILMTAFATVDTAVRALKNGAADYLTKPFHFDALHHRLKRLAQVRKYRSEVASLRARLAAHDESHGLIGTSTALRRAVRQVQTFAPHDAPVLITGETGTGKEVVARALHKLSRRETGPFVAIACGAIPSTLAESELFGHERGAFTGASTRRAGAFERADGGTLLLDDVDDLPLEIQASLLRVLQDGGFTRVGGRTELHVDVRVVATTKIDLRVASSEHRFRDELYYRLRGLEVALPPLRARGDDILLLAHHFLSHAAEWHNGPPTIDPAAAAQLAAYDWPGNVRELRYVMEACAVICHGDVVTTEHLPAFLLPSPGDASRPVARLDMLGRSAVSLTAVVADIEQRLIGWALERAGGNQTRAAELLGLARTTFQSKLGKPSGE